MWQKLYKDLAGHDFIVLSIAFDEREPARPWIEQAAPDYPCLIDRNHHVAELYHMVNVPQATWIDENGKIVRPAENAGQSDSFRHMDRTSGTMTPDQVAERTRIKSAYVEAVRDWVLNDSKSPHAYGRNETLEHMRLPDEQAALGHAHFRLAQHLKLKGNETEARHHFAEASRLHPDSWNIFRQGATKLANGSAAGPDFWKRVDSLGDRPYHLPIDIEGAR